MKKVVIIATMVILSMSLYGCGDSDKQASAATVEASGEADKEKDDKASEKPSTATESAKASIEPSASAMASEEQSPSPSASVETSPSQTPSQTPSPSPSQTPRPSPTPAPEVKASTGSFSGSDLALNINGTNATLMMDAAPLVASLGNCQMNEALSCAYDGMDRVYSNADVTILTLPIGGVDAVDEIILTSPKYSTSKGISVGDTLADVEAVYGTDYTYEGGILTYWNGSAGGIKTPRLYFEMNNDVVSSISIYGGKNAG